MRRTSVRRSSAGLEKAVIRRSNGSGRSVEMPVATITGSKEGPTFAVIAGMHGGEYAGMLAAQKLIQTIEPDCLSGKLIVVPVISTRALSWMSCSVSTTTRSPSSANAAASPTASPGARPSSTHATPEACSSSSSGKPSPACGSRVVVKPLVRRTGRRRRLHPASFHRPGTPLARYFIAHPGP